MEKVDFFSVTDVHFNGHELTLTTEAVETAGRALVVYAYLHVFCKKNSGQTGSCQ